MKLRLLAITASLLVARLASAQTPADAATTPSSPAPATEGAARSDVPKADPASEAPGAAAASAAPTESPYGAEAPTDSDRARAKRDAAVEVEQLLLDRAAQEQAENSRRIELYGFADFTYKRTLESNENPWKRVVPWRNSFAVGNFNVYLDTQLSDTWRALSEVRFMYLPNGAESQNADGSFTTTDTTVRDNTTFGEPIRWGGIHIERVWVEHTFHSLATVRVGQFLTPYGIWNVDHGSPTVIPVDKPFVVQDQLFPTSQVGIELYGSRGFGPIELGYHLTLSNGRTTVEYADFSDDKAVGGRLYLKTEAFGSFTFGTSFYRGNFYDRSKRYLLTNDSDGPLLTTTFETKTKNRELSLGADVKWQYGEFLIQGEVLMNDVVFAENARPRIVQVGATGFLPDYRRWGLYALVGYRTSFFGTMPYFVFQHAQKPDDLYLPPPTGFDIGLNIRPVPYVVAKIDFSLATWGKPDRVGLSRYTLKQLGTQIAWAF